jgi:hypothetical protein
VSVARRLFTLFACTLGLLQRGQISRGHVWGLIETTADLDDHEAGRIEDLVIAQAPQQTIAQFRRHCTRAPMPVAGLRLECWLPCPARNRRSGCSMASERLAVSGTVLRWARATSGSDEISAAERLAVAPTTLAIPCAWPTSRTPSGLHV